MYKEFIVKVIVPSSLLDGFYTLYLFNSSDKILLPIEINKWAGESIVLAKSKKPCGRPHVHNTLERVVKALNGNINKIIIYKYNDGIFYAYVRLMTKGGEVLDVDAKVTDAICLGIRWGVAICVSKEVYEPEGIKVTRDLIERSINAY